MTAPVVPAVAVYGLQVTFPGGVQALRGVGMVVESGQSVAVLGPSGSGKSSLLGAVTGLLRASAGQVLVFGGPVGPASPVGVVLQSPGRNLFAGATAAENVTVMQQVRGIGARAANARTGELLERVGLANVAGRRVRELSGGEQQRLAVAVALANRPRLLVADEPTSQIDAATGRLVTGLLRTAQTDDGMSVLVVTHDPAVAAVFDRTVHLRDGLLDPQEVA